MSNDTTERNALIVQAVIDGATLFDVAMEFKIRVSMAREILWDWHEHPRNPPMPEPDDIFHLPLPELAYREFKHAGGINTVQELIHYLETNALPNGNTVLNHLRPLDRKRTIEILRDRGYTIVEKTKPIVYETLPDSLWNECLAYWHNACVVCGRKTTLTEPLVQDHWIPHFSKQFPGSDPTNIIPLCSRCNSRKNDDPPFLFLVKTLGHRKAIHKMADIMAYFLMWFEKLENS